MIHRANAGPAPIPQKKLNPDNLAEAIKVALSPEAKTAAGKMGEQIRKEKGEEKGVESFHRHLPLKNMRYVES
jgi:UDP:flavonoid glycosyltransferase YjiC (YdhE family)